jgi:hypothetical protein
MVEIAAMMTEHGVPTDAPGPDRAALLVQKAADNAGD